MAAGGICPSIHKMLTEIETMLMVILVGELTICWCYYGTPTRGKLVMVLLVGCIFALYL